MEVTVNRVKKTSRMYGERVYPARRLVARIDDVRRERARLVAEEAPHAFVVEVDRRLAALTQAALEQGLVRYRSDENAEDSE